jgi:hypothetical protein
VTSGDSTAGVVLLILGLLLEWLLIYTAVRVAVGNVRDQRRPALEAGATASADGVRLDLVNKGTGAAFDVAMGWADDPSTFPLARTPMLPIDGRLEFRLAVAQVPDETQYVRFLKIEWRDGPDPSANHSSARRAVLVPSRLSPSK